MSYPPRRFDTIEQYKAAAALIDSVYESAFHIFEPKAGDRRFDVICPDTLEVIIRHEASSHDYSEVISGRYIMVVGGQIGPGLKS